MVGATWAYGAQVITVMAQFAYAGITSRAVDPGGFGAYAVALTVAALVSLIANGGLSQTVGRMQVIDRDAVRPLVLYGILLGLASAIFLYLTADLWALIWGVPEAATPIRWLSISAFFGPIVGLSTGLMRRIGRFRRLAALTLASNLVAMAVGVAAVTTWGTPSTLLASPITAQVLLCAGAFSLSGRLLLGVRSLRHSRAEISFSWRITIASMVSYASGNVGPWVVARSFGASTVGQWNRADVVTTVPFHQIQTAMIQVIYPEFRHDIGGPARARKAWPDLLALVAWIAIPAAGIGAVLAPLVIPILFGKGWELAASLAAPLSIIGGLQIVTTVLAAAIEALGRFRWVWATQLTALVTNSAFAAMAFALNELSLVLVGTATSLVLGHAIQIVLCARAGYITPRRLLTNYMWVIVASLVAVAYVMAALYALANVQKAPWALLACGALVLLALGSLWHWRSRLPPVRIARSYGLLGRSR